MSAAGPLGSRPLGRQGASALDRDVLALVDAWARAGLLGPTERQVADLLVRRRGVVGPEVALAAALAVRAHQRGHVGVDLPLALAQVAAAAAAPSRDPEGLAGAADPGAPEGAERVAPLDPASVPDTGPVLFALRSEPEVVWVVEPARPPTWAEVAADPRPLVLVGDRLVTQRQYADERLVAEEVLRRAARAPIAVTGAARQLLDEVLPAERDPSQRAAALTALSHRVSVLAGGPGTGKTFTVAAVVAALRADEAPAGHPPSIAVVAPTGKAAARAGEALAGSPVALRSGLDGVVPTTIHRLLGRRPGSSSRFAHDRDHRLPHDAVVVDETSMVSLGLMARLLEALDDDARLVLVGDPGQLESVESGSVLADLVTAARAPTSPLHDAVATLTTSHRVEAGRAIPQLAEAVRSGDADAVVALLTEGRPGVGWLPVEDPVVAADAVLDPVLAPYGAVVALARSGDRDAAEAALAAAAEARVLCGHRRGRFGVARWNELIEQRLVGAGAPDWFPGRLVVVGRNDPRTGLANGDTGVAVVPWAAPVAPTASADAPDGGPGLGDEELTRVVFRRGGELVDLSPARLPVVETAFATTVHKSQGSEHPVVVVVVPPVDSPLLTRELLYTAVTRAKRQVVLVGTEAAVRRAVASPSTRVSGLAAALSGPTGG